MLDFDATDSPLHGLQEGRFFHGYYDRYCYLPLYVFCGQQLLCAYLRPSRIDAAKHAAAILKLLVRRLRQAWPQVRIIFRGDSGFCRQLLINWCERRNVHYIIGLARNAKLEATVEFAQQALHDEHQRTNIKAAVGRRVQLRRTELAARAARDHAAGMGRPRPQPTLRGDQSRR